MRDTPNASLTRGSRNDLADGFDIAEDVVKKSRIVALSVSRFVIRQHDEPVNTSSCVGFDAALVKAADRCHRDFQFPQLAWTTMLLRCLSETLDVLLCLLHVEPETIPAIAQGDGASERCRTLTADHNRRRGPLDRARV